MGKTYIPRSLESFQVHKFSGYCLVTEVRLVLLEQTAAELGVLGLRDRVFDVCLLEAIEGDYDAIDFGQRILKIFLGSSLGELDFLLFIKSITFALCLRAGL